MEGQLQQASKFPTNSHPGFAPKPLPSQSNLTSIEPEPTVIRPNLTAVKSGPLSRITVLTRRTHGHHREGFDQLRKPQAALATLGTTMAMGATNRGVAPAQLPAHSSQLAKGPSTPFLTMTVPRLVLFRGLYIAKLVQVARRRQRRNYTKLLSKADS